MKCPNCNGKNIIKLTKWSVETRRYYIKVYCDDCKFIIKDWS